MSIHHHSHSRRNPLTGEWVLVSPHRTLRPWHGQVETDDDSPVSSYESGCYLCPGNERAGGVINPQYEGTFAFDNDFTALSENSDIEDDGDPLFAIRSEAGCCRVVCYTDRHDLRIATMDIDDIHIALDVLAAEFRTLDVLEQYRYVQIFENRGLMMGCSNPHPHAQIWATEHLPNEPNKELRAQQEYFQEHGSPLLCDYLSAEIRDGSRVVYANNHFVALVPYWAIWPFEALIVPRRNISSLGDIDPLEMRSLAQILRVVLGTYDQVFATQTPYSMGFHSRPSDGEKHEAWQFHVHIYPPLLRSATIRKHLVGFEMLGMPQRDLTPEVAAEKLRKTCTENE